MSPDLFPADAFFAAFGYVVLRGALTPVEVDALRREADGAIRDATGPWYRRRIAGGGIEGHYVPATCEHTPLSLDLAGRFAATVQQLTGLAMLFGFAHHALLFDAAGWHTDTGHEVTSVKVAAYLDPLDATTGALRVLPCSHTASYDALRAVLQGPSFRDPTSWRCAIVVVPSVALATVPGDVIIFDEHLWHASVGGRDRLQWSAVYVQDPTRPEDDEPVARFFASQFSPDSHLDYDPVRYPYYGDHFRGVAPRHCVARLERVGAFGAAAAEEANGRRPAPQR
jgi:Phytanoyl-CoA dioxygenase (PhyH)